MEDPLTKQDVEDAVTQALTRAFRELGIAYDPNISVQDVNEFRHDMQFLRDWRILCEAMRNKGIGVGIFMVMAAFGTVVVLGFKSWVFG